MARPVIVKPSTKYDVNQKIKTSMTILKSPRVRKLIGAERNLKIGRAIAVKKVSTSAVTSSTGNLSKKAVIVKAEPTG